MRKSLLATVAAAALIVGTGMVAAQGAKEQPGGSAGQTQMHQGSAGMKAGGESKSHAQTNGSGAAEMKSEKSEPKANTHGGKAEMNKGKSSTTGSGAAENETRGKSNAKTNAREEGKTGTESKTRAEGKNGAENKNRAQQKGKSTTGSGASERNAAGSETKSNEMKSGASANTKSTTSGSANASGSVNLTSEQKTKIRTTVIEGRNAPKISRSSINFNLSVGTVVPRDRVHFVAVTPELISIHPAWRGDYYFVVDEQLIIVDSAGRIIAVIDV